MAIYAFNIITSSTEVTRCLTSNISQRQYFVLIRFVSMLMRTLISIWTVLTEEVNVAHMYLLNSFDFALIILHYRVNSLTVFISWYFVSDVKWHRLRGKRR